MWKSIQEFLAQNFQILYVSAGMIFSCIIQIYVSRGKRYRWAERAGSSFICALFTAAITMPLLDYFPELPASISLLIGSFCGSMGDKGLRQIMHALVSKFVTGAPLPPSMSSMNDFPREMPRKYYYKAEQPTDEPPMPNDLRER